MQGSGIDRDKHRQKHIVLKEPGILGDPEKAHVEVHTQKCRVQGERRGQRGKLGANGKGSSIPSQDI